MAKDSFAQIAYISVTESASNTLTFSELNIAAELDKKKAMIVHRVEYTMASAQLEKLSATGDEIKCGISLSDSITSTGLDKVEVFDRITMNFGSILTSGQKAPPVFPIDRRFNDMPGGGLIVPVKKLYGFVQGTSLASALNIYIRIWYTIKTLTPGDYLELVDAFNILT